MFRGHLKIILLRTLAGKESSGYELMKHLQQTLGCKPSPGSLYPLLDELASQRLVSSSTVGKSKVYAITAQGKAELAALQKKRQEILQAMQNNIRMWGMLSGEDVSFQLGIFERLARGKLPFMELSSEMGELKDLLGSVHKLEDRAKRKRLRKILQRTNHQLRGLLK